MLGIFFNGNSCDFAMLLLCYRVALLSLVNKDKLELDIYFLLYHTKPATAATVWRQYLIADRGRGLVERRMKFSGAEKLWIPDHRRRRRFGDGGKSA